jgi:hypothetical protein
MTKEKALQILREIETVCKKHALWFDVKMEQHPDLKMIRVQEISIKIDDK